MRESSIEKLLQWAFRDELPKDSKYLDGRGQGGFAMFSPLNRMAELGTTIDDWSYEPGYPAAMGSEAHPDAVTIYEAVRALDEVHILWPSASTALLGELGRYVTPHEAILIRGLKVQTSALVMLHARMGNRPIWHLDYEIKHVVGKDRKSMLRKGRGRKHKNTQGEMRLDPSALALVEARLEWIVWHTALTALARDLADRLEDHLPTPLDAPAWPWYDGEPQWRLWCEVFAMDARQMASGRTSVLPALPLKPARERALPPLTTLNGRPRVLMRAGVNVADAPSVAGPSAPQQPADDDLAAAEVITTTAPIIGRS